MIMMLTYSIIKLLLKPYKLVIKICLFIFKVLYYLLVRIAYKIINKCIQ